MQETEYTYPSRDGKSQIRALIWTPAGRASQGVIQIIHGAAEHIERYRDFADFLTDKGFVVCGNDHIGHGKSVASAKDLGHMPAKGGREALLQDVHALRQKMQTDHPALPYVMFGHSMGSFILRNYLSSVEEGAVLGDGLAAAIVCGTAQPKAALTAVGNMAARLIATFKGAENRSKLLHNLGLGAYGKKMQGAKTELDWLSTDPAVVQAYFADPLCGQRFSAGAYATLTNLMSDMAKPKSAARVPKDLPLLFIAGAEDPVGDSGEGVRQATKLYLDGGVKTVSTQIYEGMRHEVLNEMEHERVYNDVLAWVEGVCQKTI